MQTLRGYLSSTFHSLVAALSRGAVVPASEAFIVRYIVIIYNAVKYR